MSSVRCLVCGEVITSRTAHDFVVCGCGHSFVDGGSDYLRAGTLNEGPIPEPVSEEASREA